METILLDCRDLIGQTITQIRVPKNYPIAALKQRLSSFRAPPDNQALIFHNKTQIADGTIEDYFRSDNVIQVIFVSQTLSLIELLPEVKCIKLEPYPTHGDILSLDLSFEKTKVFVHDSVPNLNAPLAIAWSSTHERSEGQINTILFNGVTREQWTQFNELLVSKCDARNSNKIAVAKDWIRGLDVNVFRKLSSQLQHNLQFRYEGHYKIVAHWTVIKEKDGLVKKKKCFLLASSETPPYNRVIPVDEKIGPIKGIQVGDVWNSRKELSIHGGHTPRQQGIAGKSNEYAYSIVLSGAYQDGIDDGDVIIYTGAGGRDPSTGKQISDQTMTGGNKQLALSCNAAFDESNGNVAQNWIGGVPLRVFRKVGQNSSDTRVRFDGVFKVLAYWPDKGNEGYLVWHYLLIKDEAASNPR